jgi:molecular chaperone GrpE
MQYRGNGRTIRIPVRTIQRQLPAVEDEPRPLLSGPGRDQQQVVEARPDVEVRPEVEVKAEVGEEAKVQVEDRKERAFEWQTVPEEILRRFERRAERQIRDERWRLLHRLLTVADNLERALDHADPDDPLRAGIQLTLDDLTKQLAQEGVEPVQSLGQSFDPHLHEAVATDGSGGDTVTKVLQKGYTLDGELLRPARVVVGRRAF